MRGHITVVASDREAKMMRADMLSEGRVQTEPSTVGAAHLHPRMRLPLNDFLLIDGAEVAAHVTCWPPGFAHHREEQVGEVLAHAGATFEQIVDARFDRGGAA